MSLNGANSSNQVVESAYMLSLMDKIVENGSDLDWVNNIMERNTISIKTLIEADVFGDRSDFAEDYPNATALTKAAILKAFLENKESFEEKEIKCNPKEIANLLQGFMDNAEVFDRALDTAILKEKLAGRVSWLVHLNANTKPIFLALCRLDILNSMQSLLDESPQFDKELQDWINEQKQQLFAENSLIEIAGTPGHSFLTGAANFKKLIQQEVARVGEFFAFVKNSLLGRNNNAGILNGITVSLKMGLKFVVKLGEIALLPNRILLTSIRESAFFARYSIHRLLSLVAPNHPISKGLLNVISLAAQFGLLYCGFHYFASSITLGLILGFKLFPSSWSWGFIGNIALGYAAFDFTADLAWGAFRFFKGTVSPNFENSVTQEAANDDAMQMEQSDALRLATQPQQHAIGNDQKTKLLRLLMRRLGQERADNNEENVKLIGAELTSLHNKAATYILSDYDKSLIHAQGLDANFGLTANHDEQPSEALDSQDNGFIIAPQSP